MLSSGIFKFGALEKETNPNVMTRYCTLSESFVDYARLRDYYYMYKTLVELVGSATVPNAVLAAQQTK